MSLWQVILLAVLQGLAELLPVSSSSHVILAQKLMGLDPSLPEMTFLLVMLHTGTMLAVLVLFWKKWLARLRGPDAARFIKKIVIASLVTAVIGLGLKHLIEKTLGFGEVENLFRILPLMAAALATSGVLILISGLMKIAGTREKMRTPDALWIGLVQGLALPLRGLSRSGVTISTALLRGLERHLAEEFSFALAVVLTPAAVALELHRYLKAAGGAPLGELLTPGLVGIVFSFLAGLLALKWLTRWLEAGKWKFFGIYCLVLAAAVLVVSKTMG